MIKHQSKRILVLFTAILLSTGIAYAFSNCMDIYNKHPRAIPKFKNDCSICHLNKNGTGPQNAFGRAFADSGFKITNMLIAEFPEFFLEEEAPSEDPTDTHEDTVLEPEIKRIKPKKIQINTPTTIKIKGKNFEEGAKVILNNDTEFNTTLKSNMLLTAEITIDEQGKHKIKIKNPSEQESNEVKIKAKAQKKKKK